MSVTGEKNIARKKKMERNVYFVKKERNNGGDMGEPMPPWVKKMTKKKRVLWPQGCTRPGKGKKEVTVDEKKNMTEPPRRGLPGVINWGTRD